MTYHEEETDYLFEHIVFAIIGGLAALAAFVGAIRAIVS